MTDYFLSNTYTFFKNDPDVKLLLEAVEKYNKPELVDMQVRTLNLICMVSLSIELQTLLKGLDQYNLWKDLLSITDTWTDAWIQAVSERPGRIVLCNNPTVQNYCKIIN